MTTGRINQETAVARGTSPVSPLSDGPRRGGRDPPHRAGTTRGTLLRNTRGEAETPHTAARNPPAEPAARPDRRGRARAGTPPHSTPSFHEKGGTQHRQPRSPPKRDDVRPPHRGNGRARSPPPSVPKRAPGREASTTRAPHTHQGATPSPVPTASAPTRTTGQEGGRPEGRRRPHTACQNQATEHEGGRHTPTEAPRSTRAGTQKGGGVARRRRQKQNPISSISIHRTNQAETRGGQRRQTRDAHKHPPHVPACGTPGVGGRACAPQKQVGQRDNTHDNMRTTLAGIPRT